MATIVKGDLYESIDGKLFEIKRQMRQKEGYPYDPQRLNFALQAVIEGQFEADGFSKVKSYPSTALAASHGFTVVEDVEPSKFKVSNLELVPFLKPEDGGRVNGETLRARAAALKANFGLVDAKRLLDNQAEIPTEFRGSVLVCTGTLLRDSGGDLHIAYLYWNGVRWLLLFYWVGGVWRDLNRLLRCKPACR